MKMKILRIGLPILIVAVALVLTVVLVKSRPQAERAIPEILPPLVRVLTVEPEELQIDVRTQGTVAPRTASTIAAEVNGRVVSVASNFASGGFFEKGDVLLTIDPTDHELAVVQARSQVAQAELALAREVAEADVARAEWEELGGGKASPLATRELHVEQAEAAVASAEARLRQAQRDLERTRIRAPYDGRVREKIADVGQFLNRGSLIARIFATDYVEIRLPIEDGELAFLDFDLRADASPERQPEALLQARFAGAEQRWVGRVVRMEGEIDPQTRMIHVVARVEDPYSVSEGQAPLSVGLFVDAEIRGISLDNAYRIPRNAIRDGDLVWVVDQNGNLEFRHVEIARVERNSAIVVDGLSPGERICVSSLDVVVDGMEVRTVDASGMNVPSPEAEGVNLP